MEFSVARASAAIVQRVPTAAVERFKQWQRDIAPVIRQFAGYQRTDLYPPGEEERDEWVTIIHFSDHASLQTWLDSPIRAEWVAKLRETVGDFELTKLSGGFGQWFANLSRTGNAPPPGWKMALTVLLALYPTVMVWVTLVGPHVTPLGRAFATLLANTVSVSILQWLVMPPLTRVLSPWLEANSDRQRALSIGGALAIVLTLAALAVAFRQATG